MNPEEPPNEASSPGAGSPPPVPSLPIPWWAWIFAVLCFAIPIAALGGAIPGALGVGGGVACIQLSRKAGVRVRKRVVQAATVTMGCWGGFILLAVIVTSGSAQATSAGHTKGVSKDQTLDHSDETLRRKIFSKATWLVDDLEKADARVAEDRAAGKKTKFSEGRVKHIEEMHATHLEWVKKHFDLSMPELEKILEEGFSNDWPVDGGSSSR